MRKIISLLFSAGFFLTATALEPVKLNSPDLDRGESLMNALSERHSVRAFSDEPLSLQDLSDLLWAANGASAHGKRTAPSSMNNQDILVYVVMEQATYLYDHKNHSLEPVSEGDHRQKIRGNLPALNLVLVAENGGKESSLMNVGYVSQNIYLACTALGMATVACRSSMDEKSFIEACGLSGKKKILLQHPVGYPKTKQ